MNNNLRKSTFAKGMGYIVATLAKNAGNEISDKMDIYYALLQDLPDHCFLSGVTNLLKNLKSVNFTPSPAEIREYVEKEYNQGYSEEDIQLLEDVERLTGQSFISPLTSIKKRQENLQITEKR